MTDEIKPAEPLFSEADLEHAFSAEPDKAVGTALDRLVELVSRPTTKPAVGRPLHLGKSPVKHDPRTLKLKSVFAMRPDPVDFDWTRVLPDDLGMMRNDEMGNCTCAGVGHMIQIWTAANGGEVTISDDDVVAAYKAITKLVNGVAYDPADPSTDTGLALLDVLKYWRTTGIGGHKIGGFAKLDHNDLDEIRAAGHAFGGLYTGAMLPLSAQAAIGATWTGGNGQGADAPGSWGGHCMALVAASSSGSGGVKYITWGKRQDADMSWVTECADEMYAIFSSDWVTGAKPAPSGLNILELQSYLANL